MLGIAGCRSQANSQASGQNRRVLVIANRRAPHSERLARLYMQSRKIPSDRLLLLSCPADERVSADVYTAQIEQPVRRALLSLPDADGIDYLTPVRGVPFITGNASMSVDSLLAVHAWKDVKPALPNPYFQSPKPFRSVDHQGLRLVCRLDGPSPSEVETLIMRSLQASRPPNPVVVLDSSSRTEAGYKALDASLEAAARLLRRKGIRVVTDTPNTFVGGQSNLIGYWSWGSNDRAYTLEAYRSNRFLPGAIAETGVSTSARTMQPVTSGQSVISDLLTAGVTGVKGYVSEPYTYALCPADILFDAYTAGRNLADSYYTASPVLAWKDLVIGDPFCAPFA